VVVRPVVFPSTSVTVASVPGRNESKPSVVLDTRGGTECGLLAWIDAAPGTPGQVRVAVSPPTELAFGQVDLGLDLDPALGAEEVAVSAYSGLGWVGWIEGGRALLSEPVDLANPVGPSAWTALSSDPAVPARWLRLAPVSADAGIAAAWIEAAADGDHVLLRAVDGTILGPVEREIGAPPGAIRGLALTFGMTAAWIDADGHVWVARPNR
jgi:hypothetical protein